MALPADDGSLPVCTGLRGGFCNVSHGTLVDVMNEFWQTVITAVVVVGAFAYAGYALIPTAWRRKRKRTECDLADIKGCPGGSCPGCPLKQPAAESIITVHRRLPDGPQDIQVQTCPSKARRR